MNALPKHQKYKNMYGQNELFWGLGIEEETYLQFKKPIFVAAPLIRQNHAEERYSVNYYSSFKPGYRTYFETQFPDASGCIPMPYFINSHALSKCDTNGFHQTTYEKNPKQNLKFSGKTFFEELQEFCPDIFLKEYEVNFIFDGDSIEFMTLGFYKTRAKTIIKELITYKARFLQKINEFLLVKRRYMDKGMLEYPQKNPGWAVFYTNPMNVAMFNSGTYHINITIPSLLGAKVGDEPPPLLHPKIFEQQHKQAILLYQWLEPLLIAVYGTPDPFSSRNPEFSHASQRCAMSRYIGIGTYDAAEMKEGKILTMEIDTIKAASYPYWWYLRYHEKSAYKKLEKIGLDINFKKHYNHGIELRFFDWFAEDRLFEILEFLISLADCAIERSEVDDPSLSETWNDLVLGIMQEGKWFHPNSKMLGSLEKVLGIQITGLATLDIYENIRLQVVKKYRGICCKTML